MDNQRIEKAVKEILYGIGEDPEREGLVETPKRVAKFYNEIFAGLKLDPTKHAKKVFHENDSEFVLVKDIPFRSMCEHHLLPFFGVAHIAYVPKDGKVVGLSKLARILEDISLRPQMQERITNEIARTLESALQPDGIFVMLEAEHMCMTIRGIHKPGALTVTKASRGVCENSEVRREIIQMIKG